LVICTGDTKRSSSSTAAVALHSHAFHRQNLALPSPGFQEFPRLVQHGAGNRFFPAIAAKQPDPQSRAGKGMAANQGIGNAEGKTQCAHFILVQFG
jgi:hypothetical protein